MKDLRDWTLRRFAGNHHAMRYFLTVVISLSLSGCCIPIPSTQTRMPALTTVVTSGGQPLEDAVVWVIRYETNPHFRPETAITESKQVGPDGTYRLEYEEVEETVMPLMMHGVPGYGWYVCVEHPDYETFFSHVRIPYDENRKPHERIHTNVPMQKGTPTRCLDLIEKGQHPAKGEIPATYADPSQ